MKKKNKTFLVTGGTGFLGRHIVEYLLEESNKVVVFDNDFRGSIKKIKNKNIKFIRGDIRNKKIFFKSLKSIDAIVHLAYINGTRYFYEKPDLVLDVAIKGLINLFDGCKKFKIKELYLASSSEVYQTPNRIPTTE